MSKTCAEQARQKYAMIEKIKGLLDRIIELERMVSNQKERIGDLQNQLGLHK